MTNTMKLALASFMVFASVLSAQEFEFEPPVAETKPAADEFDFEEPAPQKSDSKFTLPIRGKAVMELGRQIDNRFVFLGPFTALTLDHQASWGQIYGEGGRVIMLPTASRMTAATRATVTSSKRF